ncbi:MAG: WbuC family cupin fold metalloprotein [Verrucomicrobiales bacterium]|nr:WbuC family cupin fold metalloprotein [Verrucomicrobiales bacterium]
MKLALDNPSGEVFLLSKQQMKEGVLASRESPRRRILMPIHRSEDALVQRMLNFFQSDTYIPPHQHPREGASETIQMLAGRLAFFIFGDDGAISASHTLEPGDLIDIEAGVWHGLVILEPDTVVLEVKRGPFDATDRIFADWAPAEGEDGAGAYLRSLRTLVE